VISERGYVEQNDWHLVI